MNLRDCFDYKNRLMYDLLKNDNFVRLVDDNCNALDDPTKLIYTQVFPYEYFPETIEAGTTYVCCDVDLQKSLNKTYYSPIMYIWIMTHKSKLRLPEGGVRTDAIMAEIAETINGSRFYGLGQLDLYSVKRWAPIVDYNGKIMTFHMTEFNRDNSARQAFPVNRKDRRALS